MSKTVLPALQKRSRRTQERLLKAATEILDAEGLEGATIPRIASRAGLSPGAVYRRFPGKDALLREVCLRALQGNERFAKAKVQPQEWSRRPLREVVTFIVDRTLDGHKRHRGLLRAMATFMLEHPDAAFVRQLDELQWQTLRDVADLLLSRRREMRHPDPETAVPFALLMVGTAARGLLVMPREPGKLDRFVPHLEARLKVELTRMLLAYLGADEGSAALKTITPG